MTDEQRVKLCKKLGIKPRRKDTVASVFEGMSPDYIYPAGLALMEAYEKALVNKEISFAFGWDAFNMVWYLDHLLMKGGLEILKDEDWHLYKAKIKQDAIEAALWAVFGEDIKNQ